MFEGTNKETAWFNGDSHLDTGELSYRGGRWSFVWKERRPSLDMSEGWPLFTLNARGGVEEDERGPVEVSEGVSDDGRQIGSRVVVVGFAGAGKSTFSRVLAARTGLPLVHLDLEYWKPGWTHPSEEEWRAKQRGLVAGDAWILDGNYLETLDLLLDRADTIVLVDTPWWICAARSFRRGLRRPPGTQMPEGCEDSFIHRLRDEWGLVGAAFRDRGREAQQVRAIASKHGQPPMLYIIRSKRDAADLVRVGT